VSLLALAVLPPALALAADPARYRTYYAIFDRGAAKIPGHDTRWTPQGLAYWPEQDALVISYYDGRKQLPSRLAVVSRSSGARLKILELPTSGHVGGLSMSKNYLWVADGGRVTRFKKAALAGTPSYGRLPASGSYPTRASSFMTIVGSKLWVGDYQKDRGSFAYRYTLGKGGIPRYDGVLMSVPSQTQGMAITRDRVIWSRSTGRDNDSRIDVRPLGAPTSSAGRSIVAPNMSEGLTLAQGELHVVYESGSATYDDADYRVRTVHHAPLGKLLG
jgi:hypothetical protein